MILFALIYLTGVAVTAVGISWKGIIDHSDAWAGLFVALLWPILIFSWAWAKLGVFLYWLGQQLRKL